MTSRIDIAKRTLAAIVTVAVTSFYLSYLQRQYNESHFHKIVISTLNSLIYESINVAPRDFKNFDFIYFSDIESREYSKFLDRYLGSQIASESPSEDDEYFNRMWIRFGETSHSIAKVHDGVKIPYASSKICRRLTTSPVETFTFYVYTSLYFGSIGKIESSDVEIRWLDLDCLSRGLRLPQVHAILLKDVDKDLEFAAIPIEFMRYFPEYSEYSKIGMKFEDINEEKSRLLPDLFDKKISLSETYAVVDVRALEIMMLNIMQANNGRVYKLGELDRALDTSYQEDQTRANFLGIQLGVKEIIRVSPFILFLITYYYWRILRGVDIKNLNTDVVWAPLDYNDIFGRISRKMWALIPAVLTAAVYLIYPSAMGTRLNLLGYELSPENLLKLDFPVALAPGWYGFDMVAFVTLIFLVFHATLLIFVTKTALRVARGAVKQPSVLRSTRR